MTTWGGVDRILEKINRGQESLTRTSAHVDA
jgi:hypothetical protein